MMTYDDDGDDNPAAAAAVDDNDGRPMVKTKNQNYDVNYNK